MKLNTCIVCSGPAGSGEHVFPASLGGRRTNKNIYCETHDNGYSPLVALLDAALAPLNQIIGVVNDHTKQPKAAIGVEASTGERVKTSARGTEFVGPRVISKTALPNGEQFQMGFGSQAELDRWLEEQAKAGVQVQVLGKGSRAQYFPDTVRFSPSFGGPDGLAAAAYIAQTFLAQAFPDLARSSALNEFKRFTTTRASEAPIADRSASAWQEVEPVWWDFEATPDLGPNAFEFGHRVLVAVDGADGLIYGRVSLFSSLNFSMIFGTAPQGAQSKTVVVDIDPLAPHPPNDISRNESVSAVARVQRPADSVAGLRGAIGNGEAEKRLHELVGRLIEYALTRDAKNLHEKVQKAAAKVAPEFKKRVAELMEERLQRVWNLVTAFVEEFRKSPQGQALQAHVGDIGRLVARDPASASGLSAEAMNSLAAARDALVEQVLRDHAAGAFTADRAAELLGRGPGMAVVGEELLMRWIESVRSTGSSLASGPSAQASRS